MNLKKVQKQVKILTLRVHLPVITDQCPLSILKKQKKFCSIKYYSCTRTIVHIFSKSIFPGYLISFISDKSTHGWSWNKRHNNFPIKLF